MLFLKEGTSLLLEKKNVHAGFKSRTEVSGGTGTGEAVNLMRIYSLISLQVFVESKSSIFGKFFLTKSSTITRQRELRPDEMKLQTNKQTKERKRGLAVSQTCDWKLSGTLKFMVEVNGTQKTGN